MSVFTSIYFDLDKKSKKGDINTNTNVNKKIPEKNMIEIVEKKIDKVFSNMKKRNSNTNFQIDYPWLTI